MGKPTVYTEALPMLSTEIYHKVLDLLIGTGAH
jgi:hypothetical protein